MFIALLRKELRLVRANAVLLITLAAFALVLSVLLSYGLLRVGGSPSERQDLLPGMLISAGLFVATGLFSQTALLERDGEALLALKMAGFSSAALFFSKLLSNFLIFLLLLLLLAGFLGLFFESSILRYPAQIFAIAFLFGFGVCALGTLLSMISAAVPNREILFPVLFFPLMIPICGAAMFLLHELFSGGGLNLASFPAKLLFGCAVLYAALGTLLFEEVA